MNAMTAGGIVLSIAIFSLSAQPRVCWAAHGLFEVEYRISFRWPPEEPPNHKPGYEPRRDGTLVVCIGNSLGLILMPQQLWIFAIPLWAYGAVVVVAIIPTVRILRLIREDGGFRRTRNAMEKLLLWGPFGALLTLDVVVVLTAPTHLGALLP